LTLGFVWQYQDWTNPGWANTSLINQYKDVDVTSLSPVSTLSAYYQLLGYARPSSNHPGVVVVSFCDGHQQTLSENIAITTLQSLMVPDDNSVITAYNNSQSSSTPPQAVCPPLTAYNPDPMYTP
jgi:hypothetical protein